MNVEEIFVTPLFHDFLNLNLDDLRDYAYRLQGQSDGRTASNRLGWQSNDIQYDEEVQSLVNAINERLIDVHTYTGLSQKVKLVVDNMWININFKYSYNHNHIHPKSIFSGSFYIDVPEKSGILGFRNPSPLQRIFVNDFNNKIDTLNNFVSQNWNLQPKPNMLVMFPSWIEHDVEQNLSDETRISIAFNTTLQ